MCHFAPVDGLVPVNVASTIWRSSAPDSAPSGRAGAADAGAGCGATTAGAGLAAGGCGRGAGRTTGAGPGADWNRSGVCAAHGNTTSTARLAVINAEASLE